MALNATQIANRVRTAFLGEGPLLNAVDPVWIARQVGINVYSAALDNNLSGMIAKTSADSDPDIFLNNQHAAVRQRFTCAHELGHYFYIEEMTTDKPSTYIHKRDARSSCGVYSEEVFANGFAAELLMPAADVRRVHGLGEDTIAMAKRFNVSFDAISNRLKALQLS